MKKFLLTALSLVTVAALAITGTIAYLTSEDSEVNVMTTGNVTIAQHEYERVVDTDGNYETITVTKADGSTQESYKLQEFTQGKPLYPAVGNPNGGYTSMYARFEQLDSPSKVQGGQAFLAGIKNAQDKIVLVENTGTTDAYVRTLFAFELGSKSVEEWNSLIRPCFSAPWKVKGIDGAVTIDGNNYCVMEAVYTGYSTGNMRHNGGILPAGEWTYNSLAEIYMTSDTTNEDVEAFDGNNNGTYDILVLSQGVQVTGFANAQTALDTGFGKLTDISATTGKMLVVDWFEGVQFPVVGTQVSADNLASVDFTAENTKFVFNGEFDAVAISELGDGSVIFFNNAAVGDLTFSDDAILEGTATIKSIKVARNSTKQIVATVRNADLDIEGAVSAVNTDGKSVLNIENSRVESASIDVGAHVNNHRAALAELNIVNSYVSCEENNLGSTISVWGRSGAKATIYDSEIYTYSRGWHQSEDANDNSITIQGATSIDVDIQRSNMHLYGARSIINARQYGSEETIFNTNIDESLIWVVTKSSHGENTIPVWGFNEANINDTILLFTKNVHQSTPAIFKSFVYGNPVIHGEYHVTTQCQWDAPIALADGQTVTFASDANVSIYDGAGNVEFVKTGSAKVVAENGAVVKNIGIN